MRSKRPLSTGSILMLVLTAAVLLCSLLLYTRITDPNAVSHLNAESFAAPLSVAQTTPTPAPSVSPAPTIRTTVVTIEQPVVSADQSAAPGPDETAETEIPSDAVGASPTPAFGLNTEEETDAASATAEPSRAVTLTAAGMAQIQTDITDAALNAGSADYVGLMDALRPYVAGDMCVLPFEGVLSGTTEKYSDLLALPGAATAVKNGGFDAVLLNHEHILDYGADVAQQTVDAFRGAGISAFGVHMREEPADILELGGVKTAVLTYTSVASSKTKEQLKTVPEALNLFSADDAVKDIEAARGNGAQLVVVCVHWGKADANGVTNSQREAAKKMAAAGADVILGANSNAVLPLEIIETGDRKTLAVYSLGTLLSESRSARAVISGVVLNIRLLVYDSGRVRIDEVRYTPTYVWKQKVDGAIRFAVLPSADEAPAQMNDDQKKNMANALKLIDKVMANGPAKR